MQKDELLAEIRRYAILKRQQGKGPDAMYVDAIHQIKRESVGNQSRGDEGNWPWIQACTGTGSEEEWGGMETWEEEAWGPIDEIRNGKGKGKLFVGERYSCGNGDIQRITAQCKGKVSVGRATTVAFMGTQPSSAQVHQRQKDTGKGKGQRTCGKGNWGQGQGGTWEIDYEEEDYEEEEKPFGDEDISEDEAVQMARK
jgi:hypothetical protein